MTGSTVLSRVKAFLPQLEEGNRELAERLQGTNGEELDIECVEEGNPCIQMVRGASIMNNFHTL